LSPIRQQSDFQGKLQVNQDTQQDEQDEQGESSNYNEPIVSQVAEPRQSLRGRTRQPNPCYFGNEWENSSHTADNSFFKSMDWKPQEHNAMSLYFSFLVDKATDTATDKVLYQHPGMFAIQANAEDNPRLQDIFRLQDQEEIQKWMTAMDLELDELQYK
jgi:hypothetical protein